MTWRATSAELYMKDVQADHDSCKEYERAAIEAQKKGTAALDWIHERYVVKAGGLLRTSTRPKLNLLFLLPRAST